MTGCATAEVDPGDDPMQPDTPAQPTTCDGEPLYGDGTCHIDLACGIPDVDCFVQFSSDAAAREQLMQSSWADYYTMLPTTDSHYAKAREQLDKSWDLFKSKVPMDKLADKRLALILVQDPDINAFVAPSDDPGKAYWAVFFNTGTLDANLTADQMHGLIFHELTHLVKHHTSVEVKDATRKVYVTGGGTEPIGADQTNLPAGSDVFQQWLTTAQFAGAYTSPDLADLPYGGDIDWLFQQFYAYVPYLSYPASSCTSVAQRVQTASRTGTYADFDQTFKVSATQKADRETAIDALKQCIGTDTFTFRNLRDYLEPYAPYVFETFTTADASKFDSMRAFDGLLAVMADRRAKLRALQTQFTSVTGRPWTEVRYFSTEEQADDLSTRVTTLTGIDEVGVTGIMYAALASEAQRCRNAVAGAIPVPYGENLKDDHHGSCWRIKHAEQFAEQVMDRRHHAPQTARVPWTPTVVSTKPVY